MLTMRTGYPWGSVLFNMLISEGMGRGMNIEKMELLHGDHLGQSIFIVKDLLIQSAWAPTWHRARAAYRHWPPKYMYNLMSFKYVKTTQKIDLKIPSGCSLAGSHQTQPDLLGGKTSHAATTCLSPVSHGKLDLDTIIHCLGYRKKSIW